MITGEVEREGTFWVENLPLYSGTNWLTLWVTNAAGYSSETNIMVVQSTLNLTIYQLTGDLWQPTVTVYGTISDPDDYTVWVNGVEATVTGNNWEADNVPLPGGSTPMVQARAIPNSDHGGNGTVNASGPVSYADMGNPDSPQAPDAEIEPSQSQNENAGVKLASVYWSDTSSVWSLVNLDYLFELIIHALGWDAANGGSFYQYTGALGGSSSGSTSIPAGDAWQPGGQYQEEGVLLSTGASSFELEAATAKMMLHTGGKSGVGKQGLFALTATATERVPVSDSGGEYHQAGIVDGPGVSYDQITMDGQQLGSDGIAWKV